MCSTCAYICYINNLRKSTSLLFKMNYLFENLFIVISSVTPLEKKRKKKDIKLRKYCSQAKSHQIIYTFFVGCEAVLFVFVCIYKYTNEYTFCSLFFTEGVEWSFQLFNISLLHSYITKYLFNKSL